MPAAKPASTSAADPATGAQRQPPRKPPSTAPVGVAAATGVGTVSGIAGAAVATVPPVVAAALTADEITDAFERFLRLVRFHDDQWVRTTMRGRGTQDDILETISRESGYQAEYERKVRARLARDVPKVLALPEEKRAAALERLIARERLYARQRSEAMAVRAFAVIDELVLRRESPAGAFWKLDPNVKRHTPDCIAMGGKFWPWPALDVLSPPTHTGCKCGLHAYATAIARGWLKPRDVMDVKTALSRVQAAKSLLEERELEEWEAMRDALIGAGLTDEDGFARAVQAMLGRNDGEAATDQVA